LALDATQKEKLAALLAQEHVAVLVTQGEKWPTANLQAFAETPEFDLLFIMGGNADKYQNLLKHPEATVLVDNRAVRSCQLTVANVAGKEIVTLEGLETAGKPHPVQAAFIAEQTFQCGYCLNGWVMTTKALLDKNPSPSDAEMRNAFESLVCRCGSHVGIFAAVRRASQSAKRSA